MRAALTLTGMLKVDDTLFNGVQVPAGVDLETLVDTIVWMYGDLYLVNTDLEWTKRAITLWGKRQKYYMDELLKTLEYQYNPIDNYDRWEEYTDTTSRKSSFQGVNNGTSNSRVTAYDSDVQQPDSQVQDTSTAENSGTEDGTLEHVAHLRGNIGTVTTQSMIREQREIIKISWYDEIAKLFASEFLLMVY